MPADFASDNVQRLVQNILIGMCRLYYWHFVVVCRNPFVYE